jgi:HAAS
VIDGYLDELGRELRAAGVTGDRARRLLAEARDHLLELAAVDGEAEAVRRFGPAGEVASDAAAELATALGRRAAYGSFAALALAGAGYLSSLLLVQHAGGWPDIADGEIAVVGVATAIALVLLPQVAFVAGSLALLRILRSRHEPLLREPELGLVRRRAATGLAAGALTAASWALWAVEFRNAAPLAEHEWVAFAIAGVSAAVVLALGAASVAISRAGRPRAATGGRTADVFDDFEPVFAWRPVARLDLPAHGWRFAVLAAAGVAATATILGWIAEGDPGGGLVRGVFEGAALLACFALLGRPLGLRR